MLWSFVLKQLSKEAVELKMTTNKLQQEAEKQVFQLKSKVISLLLFNVGVIHDNKQNYQINLFFGLIIKTQVSEVKKLHGT